MFSTSLDFSQIVKCYIHRWLKFLQNCETLSTDLWTIPACWNKTMARSRLGFESQFNLPIPACKIGLFRRCFRATMESTVQIRVSVCMKASLHQTPCNRGWSSLWTALQSNKFGEKLCENTLRGSMRKHSIVLIATSAWILEQSWATMHNWQCVVVKCKL